MDLSICTVSFRNAKEIRWNIELARHLNPDVDFRWIVSENTPMDSPDRLSNEGKTVTVLPDAGTGHTPTYHHTIALTNAIRTATTRFILVLDPDFFVVRPGWARLAMEHMMSHELGILGVPWHPKRSDKYRYFPAVHYSLFDTERFARDDIDFRPHSPDGDSDPAWPDGYEPEDDYFAVQSISRWLAMLPVFRRRRRFYTDTGGRLLRKYARDKTVAFELLQPIYDLDRHRANFHWLTRMVEWALPDELCYVPKHYQHNIEESFLHRYTEKPVPGDWEEFLWDGFPFGFHLRRNANSDARTWHEEIELAGRIIAAIMQKPTNSTNQALYK